MSDVLVVQPDAPQTEALRTVFRRIGADLVIVHSTAEAMDAIDARVPDVILLSSLLSPIEEDALVRHLRTLDNASHIQTLRLPQFKRDEVVEEPAKGGFFSRKKKKAKPAAPSGCDPAVFAEEVVAHLLRANEIRNRPPAPKLVPPEARPAVEQQDVEAISSVDAISPAAMEAEPASAEPSWDAPQALYSWNEPLASEAPLIVNDAPSVLETPTAFNDEPLTNDEPLILETPSVLAEADEPAVSSVLLDEPPAPSLETPEPILEIPEPPVESPQFTWAARPSPTSKPAPLPTEPDEVDRLARELGLELKIVDIDEDPQPVRATAYKAPQEDAFDFAAALDRAREEAETRHQVELARAEADAIAIREAAIAEARALAEREAREAVAADIARIQAEAETMRLAALAEAETARDAAIAEARAVAEREAREARAAAEREAREARVVAEREAREALDAELARVRSETQETVADALNKVKREAQEAERARAEADRLRAEAQEALAADALKAKLEAEEAERARAEAERLRIEAQEAFAAELARVRAEVEQKLAAQLQAARADAERMHEAEEAAVRDRASAETQLKAEIDRLKFVAAQSRKSDESEVRKAADQIKQLERELATVHAKTEQRHQTQLDDLRQQMADLREAAAQHARNAAAQAVASEVARVQAEVEAAQPKLNVVRMQPRHQAPMSVAAPIAVPVREPVAVAAGDSRELRGDYYSLWHESEPAEAVVEEPQAQPDPDEEPAEPPIDFRRHAKWALPAAACLLLVVNTSTISTVARLVGPAPKAPALTVEPLQAEPFIEVVQKRVGRLRIESTPAGVEALIDGRSYGKTPITIPDLEVGAHTLVLKGREGTITRRVSVKANETAVVAEAIFSGWLAVFSPIPVTAMLDGRPVNLTDDGRLMASPGKHVLELVSDRFNYRTKETLEVRPGETTAYTLSLPTETVRITAPAGAEIRIDGQPAGGVAADGVPVTIGSHQIAAIHPELGERRIEVDVRHGGPADVTVPFE